LAKKRADTTNLASRKSLSTFYHRRFGLPENLTRQLTIETQKRPTRNGGRHRWRLGLGRAA